MVRGWSLALPDLYRVSWIYERLFIKIHDLCSYSTSNNILLFQLKEGQILNTKRKYVCQLNVQAYFDFMILNEQWFVSRQKMTLSVNRYGKIRRPTKKQSGKVLIAISLIRKRKKNLKGHGNKNSHNSFPKYCGRAKKISSNPLRKNADATLTCSIVSKAIFTL